MKLWRLYRCAHGAGLDGAGGLLTSGRWHKQGTPAVYFGATATMVVLGKLAHIDQVVLPAGLVLGRFEGSVSVEEVLTAGVEVSVHRLS